MLDAPGLAITAINLVSGSGDMLEVSEPEVRKLGETKKIWIRIYFRNLIKL